MIYIITMAKAWSVALKQGFFETDALQSEGFIHACTDSQLTIVMKKFYDNIENCVILHVNESKLLPKVIYELSPTFNEAFPHIYGTVNIDAVENVSIAIA